MLIEVKQSHIDAGERADCGHCPVALAIREQTEFKRARVTSRSWRTGESRSEYLPINSEVVNQFVFEFDGGMPVKPFSFELEVPA